MLIESGDGVNFTIVMKPYLPVLPVEPDGTPFFILGNVFCVAMGELKGEFPLFAERPSFRSCLHGTTSFFAKAKNKPSRDGFPRVNVRASLKIFLGVYLW
jgi:hypothetical protein